MLIPNCWWKGGVTEKQFRFFFCRMSKNILLGGASKCLDNYTNVFSDKNMVVKDQGITVAKDKAKYQGINHGRCCKVTTKI